ncbi:hypothetical protein [Arthrobacter sp. ISL-95]|uniref:hypothetical protein n=1 Tax=Arthrobacter sp. ISL-95 TaxID=2819116 RepID=UPI001BE684DA|nr:hypothetical protein [Arthrobacter sp. ISL-95]MBT2586486.1 hypothetical protein [Arthrobacter sp. ISL-95]
MAEKLTLDWDDLRDLDLDPENPRHDRGLTRPVVIEQFVKRENIKRLARDITDHGLSPLERFGAVRDAQNELVIVEGNRRLCAMMLLHDPALAPTPEDRKYFERLSKRFDPTIVELDIQVFESREEADIWLERKHMGENAGLGTRGWNPVQQARHFGDTGNTLALALIDYAVDNKLISSRPEGILTTVTRFMSNPYVRKHGLFITTGASEAEFAFTGTRSLFDRRLRTLLVDIINGTHGAHSRTTADDREAYAKKYLVPMTDVEDDEDEDIEDDAGTSGGQSQDGAGDESDNSDQSGGTGQSEDESADPTDGGSTNRAAPNRRTKLVDPAEFHPSLRDNGLRRILGELHVVTKRTPALAAVGVRIFIESIAIAYLENRLSRKVVPRDKLHVQVQEVLADISAKAKLDQIDLTTKEKSSLSILHNRVTDSAYLFSAAYLGAVAHGSAFPQWEQLTAAWDEIAPIMFVLATNCEVPLEGNDV